ncbi:hypothetical protein H9651_13305 [Microbacterium sp. Sa4CUA7]|uniref:Uncharacterized protein n=1 Tax=Microbacterium pullorum TaxID=2762236 RepID=A0ABR8S574_9MICO|nr:hypothetical protein [Microbacterium pullorum]MBD7958617.1 hypothetical protein [Microbacterium pullorum]
MSTTHAVGGTTDAIRLPPVLPVISMTIATDGTMTVAVDGVPFEPPRFGPAWVRSSFAPVIDTVLETRGSPVRVLVYETDGTVFTDLVTRPLQGAFDPNTQPQVREDAPAKRTLAADAPTDPVPLIAPPHTALGEEGFLPGEDVAVAIIVRHTKASADGSARALLERGVCQCSADGEVMLVGRTSGTCVIGNLT